jgi:hypothetical protein
MNVLAIRRFFKDNNAILFINVGMLMRHAVSFGLYLLTTVAFYVAFTAYALFPESDEVFGVLNLTAIFYYSGQLLSEALLCSIIWALGKESEETPHNEGILKEGKTVDEEEAISL